MLEKSKPLVQTCADCGALIDVSEEEPFALMHCPTCGGGMRVRRSFDHFEIQETLGSGGMGAVYRALDANLNRMVALKLLHKEYSADPQFVSQFKTEAAVTASINHPHVVKVFSSGEDHGLLYIAMELVDQGSLDDLMEAEGQVGELRLLELGIQIAQGLNAALQRGLIHRDIKPGNILFADANNAKIVDFGLASLTEEARNEGGEIWGTPYYVAPEKLDHQPEDARSDIYSLGATLFHALSGRPPFEGETASVSALRELKRRAANLESVMPTVSSATAYVINKALHQDPAQRHQNYEELIKGLQYAHTELSAKLRAQAQAQTAKQAANAGPWAEWITWGVTATLIAAGVGFFKWNQNQSKVAAATPVPEIHAQPAQATVESRFEAARELILAEKFTEGAAALEKLEHEENVPQPLLNWITIHEALALLLAGKDSAAHDTFARIVERGPFSADESEVKQANFFMDVCSLLAHEGPAPLSTAKSFDNNNYQSFALLLAGLKDWNMESFEDGATLLRRFRPLPTADIPPLSLGGEKELRRLKRLAMLRVADYDEFHNTSAAIAAASDPAKKKEVLELAKASVGRLKFKTKMIGTLEASIAQLQDQVTAHEAEVARAAQEQEAADFKALVEAKQKRTALAAQLKFAEAHAAIVLPKLSAPKPKLEQEMLASKSEWLVKFKAMLVRDINLVGYAQPIGRKSAQPVPGGATKADDLQIQIRTQYGFLPIAWSDVSFESAYAMAHSFIRPGLPPELEAERKWLLGAFASFAGKTTESRTLFTEAAQLKPEYATGLPLFLEFVETP